MKKLTRLFQRTTVVMHIVLVGALCALFLGEEELDIEPPVESVYIALACLGLASSVGAMVAERPAKLPERGEVLVLARYKLSENERRYVLEFLDGASMKEIAKIHGISYSTVRNTFSSVYKKLDISGSPELLAMGSRYHVQ
jgi:DNA-binding CsgD family transcriptional regulator